MGVGTDSNQKGNESQKMLDFRVGESYMSRMTKHKKGTRRHIFDGERLKAERLRQGYSFAQLAQRMARYEPKVSKQHIWGWERALCEPTPRYWYALSRALSQPIEYFLTK